MKQAIYGIILFIFLALPPVVDLAESIMAIHIHAQMPLIGIAGMLMAPYLQQKFPRFFEKWNENGVPGIVLFLIDFIYWVIPRAMDDALASGAVEVFNFFSWAFLIGVPLRLSWPKLTKAWQYIVLLVVAVSYSIMAVLYLFSPDQLCNNYLIVDQRILGWSFLLIVFVIILYILQDLFIDKSAYEAE